MRKILNAVREIDWKEFFIDMAIFVVVCLLVDWVFYLLK
jgi:hypothetical protein